MRNEVLLCLLVVGPIATPTFAQATREKQVVYWDSLDDQGQLFGGMTTLDAVDPLTLAGTLPATAETLTHTAAPVNPLNRIDLVFVGDGYTTAQLPTYAAHVNNIVGQFFTKEPYLRYEPYFTVHRVDVASVDSGVDNDPTQGILRNTALDMSYWCNGTERLLCVSVSKAYQFANNAPDVDLVCAIANSTKYGGAGYPSSDLGTAAGNNNAALEIVRHEFGHALGNLGDEYDYGGPTTYTGNEPSAFDLSKLAAAQMTAQQQKWWRWLGDNNAAFDGLVSTFEGAGYSQFGLYRPSNNSLMRNLNRPFNLPSCESMVVEIYKIVRPIDDASSTAVTYTGTETLFVDPLQPVGQALSVQWFLDGVAIPGATGSTLDLTTLSLGGCPAMVSVRVTDDTFLVRDPASRAQWLTQTLDFSVQPAASAPFANFCATSPNSVGPGAVLSHQGSSSIATNDLRLVATGCPPHTFGLFYFGGTQTQAPFGNGFRCVGGSVTRFGVQGTNEFGDADRLIDYAALPGSAGVAVGATRYFQFWYRNPAAGGAGFNLSDGLSVRFCP